MIHIAHNNKSNNPTNCFCYAILSIDIGFNHGIPSIFTMNQEYIIGGLVEFNCRKPVVYPSCRESLIDGNNIANNVSIAPSTARGGILDLQHSHCRKSFYICHQCGCYSKSKPSQVSCKCSAPNNDNAHPVSSSIPSANDNNASTKDQSANEPSCLVAPLNEKNYNDFDLCVSKSQPN